MLALFYFLKRQETTVQWQAEKSEIKAAWDRVSSLSSAAAGAVFQLTEAELQARSAVADKIFEDYCSAIPDADECRVYDD
jgi:CP12 domain